MTPENITFNAWAENLKKQLDEVHIIKRKQAEENFKLLLGDTYGKSNKRNKRNIRVVKNRVY